LRRTVKKRERKEAKKFGSLGLGYVTSLVSINKYKSIICKNKPRGTATKKNYPSQIKNKATNQKKSTKAQICK